MDYAAKIQNIIKNNHGFISAKECASFEIPRVYLSRLTAKGTLYKVAPGVYATKDAFVDPHYVFYLRHSKVIFSFYNAVYFLRLADRALSDIEVTVPNPYNTHLFPKEVIVHKCEAKLFDIGKIFVETDLGHQIPCYNLERTVVDLIRNKDKIESETFQKALHAYAKRKDKNINQLLQYAIVFRIEKKTMMLMEALLDE